jgi:agmatine deiminase
MKPKSQPIPQQISYTSIILESLPTMFRQSLPQKAVHLSSPHKAVGRFRMPPEWHKHSQTLTVWPDYDSIGDADILQKARSEVSAISNAIAHFEPVTMFSRPKNIKQAIQTVSKNVTVRALNASQLWVRDTGPVFAHEVQSDRSAGLKLGFNYWGGKFPSTGDETVAADVLHDMTSKNVSPESEETISGQPDPNGTRQTPSTGCPQRRAVPGIKPGFISEGGAIEVDGQGTLLATESSIINSNRNPGMSKKELEEKFEGYLGISKTIWLPGVKDYDVTDYHIDAFARFIKPGQVLLSRPSRHAKHCVIQAYIEAKEVLDREKDSRGSSLEVVEVEEPHVDDLAGELWGVAVASYANYYLVNGGLIMPRFGVEKLDDEAYEFFKRYFPGREIVQVDLNTLPKLGGGIHCATQQVPAAF